MSGPTGPIEMDTSLAAWFSNAKSILHFPSTILLVAGLLVAGTFAETAPRKSFLFMDNVVGSSAFFLVPILIVNYFDWPTGLLAAVVALILFTRLQKEDKDEGFQAGDVQTTKLVPDSHRWFVEKVLGERPVAISSEKILTSTGEDSDTRTSSSSSMSSVGSSDSTR